MNRHPQLMPLVKELIAQGLSNSDIQDRLMDSFDGTNPQWLRARICNYRSLLKKKPRPDLYPLFEHMVKAHGLTMIDDELRQIVAAVGRCAVRK
jgi:hypothetical protein